MGLVIGLLPLHHPFQARPAQPHVVLTLINRRAEPHHAAAQAVEPPARQLHVTRHHVGAKLGVFRKHQLNLPVAPGKNQVKLTAEFVQAQAHAFGQRVALAIAAVKAFVLAKAGEINRNDKLHRVRRHLLANPLRRGVDFRAPLGLARPGDQRSGVLHVEAGIRLCRFENGLQGTRGLRQRRQ